MNRAAAPPKIVKTEILDVAKALFRGENEPNFVIAVLDHVARAARPEAF